LPIFHSSRYVTLARQMSALDQKQTLGKVRLMSALPPKADIGTHPRNVRFVPKADIRPYSITSSTVPRNDQEIAHNEPARERLLDERFE